MILYNVTYKVEHQVHANWLKFMQFEYIPAAMATNVFEEYKITRLLGVDEEDGITYAVQLLASSLEAYRIFQQHHALALSKRLQETFAGQYVAFTTLMRVVDKGR
jgi:hypothetical protein